MDSLAKIGYRIAGWVMTACALVIAIVIVNILSEGKLSGNYGTFLNCIVFLSAMIIFRWASRWDLKQILKETEEKLAFKTEKLKNIEESIRGKFGKGGQIEPQEEEDCLIEIIEEKNEQD